MQSPSPAGHGRQIRVLLLTILLVVSSLSTALAQTASPAPASDMQLYLSHPARLTARIPADWKPDRSLDHDYAGPDGFVASASTAFESFGYDSIEEVCDGINATMPYAGTGTIELMPWRGIDACTIRPADMESDDGVTLAFAHPDRAPDGSTLWAAVTVDAAHFEAVIDSISFDLSGITAAMYLDAALDIVETHFVLRDNVDWTDVREAAHQRLGGFADTDAWWVADDALEMVVDTLHDVGADEHTFFVPATRVDMTLLPAIESYIEPSGEGLDGGIGYIAVPKYTAGAAQSGRYTGALHAIIGDEAPSASCGWIVDLRDNRGGGITPMVMGLAPLLPAGPLLDLRGPSGDTMAWNLAATGLVEIDGVSSPMAPEAAAPDPRLEIQPVAVLIGPYTASAGESTAIAFIDRDRTVFFGATTAGLATGPVWISLLNGSLLSITTDWMVGPQGAVFPDGIAPDVTVVPSDIVDPLADDPVVQAASDWLLQQPGCAADATPAT